jgi:beta-glucosidase
MIIVYILLGLVVVGGGLFVGNNFKIQANNKKYRATLGSEAPTVTVDGHTFRDLNKNGQLDPYEDFRLPIEARVEDLLSQMTVTEKAGMMFQTMIGMNKDGSLIEKPANFMRVTTTDFLANKLMNHFNVMQGTKTRLMAEWHNRLQKMAERTRLGIPVTLSTDPRHAFSYNPGAAMLAGDFSKWPEQIGLGAIGDPDLVEEFGDIARQEYVAVGIRTALHPMIDLATEPRWCRSNGTFGEDAELSAKLAKAYIRGFQGEAMGPESVACMTKHFPGGGPQKDGEDAHFTYGKDQVYPGDNFDYHLIPFAAAFEAGTSQIMPYYGRPLGTELEEVGFAYSKQVITEMLRGKYGFDGIVCTDWGLVNDYKILGKTVMAARAWGAEHLSTPARAKKIIEAGCDQFGGENCPEVIIALVNSGQLSEERIDESIRRLLREKFKMGLFDNPYVDPDQAEAIVGQAEFMAAGELAQRKSIVLLKNAADTLPLKDKPKIFVEKVDPAVAGKYGQVVDSLAEADYAILRLSAPFEPRKGMLERFFHGGDLDFKGKELERILNICEQVPTLVDIYLERAAVIPEVAEKCVGLTANFGANDGALLDVIFGEFNPTGKLPYELPASMAAVRNQKEDLPHDSENPLFSYGHGLSYS